MSSSPSDVLVWEVASKFELLGLPMMITHAKNSNRWNHTSAIVGLGDGSISFGQGFYNLV